MNKARALFKILHAKGEVILKSEVVAAAVSDGWTSADADELGSLAQQIGEGKNPRVTDGPWWAADIFEKIVSSV